MPRNSFNLLAFMRENHYFCKILYQKIRRAEYYLKRSAVTFNENEYSMKRIFITLVFAIIGTITALSQTKSQPQVSNLSAFEDSICIMLERFHSEWPRKRFDDFVAFLRNNPSTLTYPFEKLKKKNMVKIFNSDDGRMRIYRVRIFTNDGYISPFISITQYKGASGVKIFAGCTSYDTGDETWGYQYSSAISLHTLPLKSETIYLAGYGSSESQYSSTSYTAIAIEGDKMKPRKIILDHSNETTYCLHCGCNGVADWYFRSDGKGWEKELIYDKSSKEVHILRCDEQGYYNEKFDIYKIDGDRLVYSGQDCGIDLCPSLKPIQGLIQIIYGKEHTVRVDRVNPTLIRYASWKAGRPTTSEPDFIITKNVPADYYRDEVISFQNGGYTYNVDIHEVEVEVKDSKGKVVNRVVTSRHE